MKLVFTDGTSVEVLDETVPIVPALYSEMSVLVRTEEDSVELSLTAAEMSQLVSFLNHYA